MKSHWSKHKLHVLLFSVPCVLCSNACPEELCCHSTTVSAAPSPIQCTLGSSTITKTAAAVSLSAPSYPFKIWQRLDHLEGVDPPHMFTIILEHSRPPNNGPEQWEQREHWWHFTLAERRIFLNSYTLYQVWKNFKYSLFYNFGPTFRKLVNLFYFISK